MIAQSRRSILLAATLLAGAPLLGRPAQAQDQNARLSAIERQIQALQAELRQVKHAQDVQTREARAAIAKAGHGQAQATHEGLVMTPLPDIPDGYALVRATPGATPGSVVLSKVETPAAPKLPMGAFRVGNVTITLGGFIDTTGIFRSRNETADIASNFNTGIPLPNSPNYHETEFRGTARQSRLSGMVEGNPDSVTKLIGYVETDFQGAAPTSNSVSTNGYVLRLRQGFAEYDRSDLGLTVLAGQAWTLLTLDKFGIVARKEDPPIGIDSSYVAGFSYARQPQLRIVKSFDNQKYWLAFSAESPQTTFYTGPNGLAPSSTTTVTINNPGASGFASTNNYTVDVAPDFQVKAAAELGPAHLEAYGVLRILRDRVSHTGSGQNNYATAGGAGAGAVVHLIPTYLDVEASFLAGQGIGRYGAAQLPDAIIGRNGQPVPLPEVQALVGVIGHPVPSVDLFGYIGTEQTSARYFAADVKGKTLGYGYGSPLYVNSSCNTELGAAAECVGNTSGVVDGTVGGWWRFEHGPYGTMQVGAQYAYVHRAIFQGVGPTPKTDDNIVMLSFRYYPFQ